MTDTDFDRRLLWSEAMMCAMFSIAAFIAITIGMIYQFYLTGPITNPGLAIGWGMSMFAFGGAILTLWGVRDDVKNHETQRDLSEAPNGSGTNGLCSVCGGNYGNDTAKHETEEKMIIETVESEEP